jgi:hypothetical protein
LPPSKGEAGIHLTPNGDAMFLFTDQGDLIRAQLTPQGDELVALPSQLLRAGEREGIGGDCD